MSPDSHLADIAIVEPDGTVYTLYNNQTGATYSGTSASGVSGQSFTMETIWYPYDPADTTHYFMADHLGTARMEFAGAGWPVWGEDFAPYGQEVNPAPTSNIYKFTGYERDPETGDDYAQARFYSSSIPGRFMSADPYLGSMDITNPQSFNRYTYALNNPVAFVDPTGLDGWYFNGGTGCWAYGWTGANGSSNTEEGFTNCVSYDASQGGGGGGDGSTLGLIGEAGGTGGGGASINNLPPINPSFLHTLFCGFASDLRLLSQLTGKTIGVGFGGSFVAGFLPGVGLNFTASAQIVADPHGGVGLAFTGGGGPGIGIGAMLGGQGSVSDAELIEELPGTSKDLSFSVGEEAAFGVDVSEGLTGARPVTLTGTLGPGVGAKIAGSYGTTGTGIPLSTNCNGTPLIP